MGALSIWLRKRGTRELVITFAAGAILLLASLANFLSHNVYPYFRLEVGIIALGISLLSVIMAFFYRAQRQWGRSVLEGILVALFLDLNIDTVPIVMVAGIGVAAFTYWRRISLLEPLSLIGGIILLSNAAGIGTRSDWINSTVGNASANLASAKSGKPAVFHFILDEHVGIEGLPDDEEGRQIREELRTFYLDNGFALYGGAYSRHSYTVNAIPELLNFGAKWQQKIQKDGLRIGRNNYLQALIDQGYKLTIFQSDFVDYCSEAEFSECITYDSTSLGPNLRVTMGTADRVGLLTAKFLELTSWFDTAATLWNLGASALHKLHISLPFIDTKPAQSSTVGSLESLDELTNRITASQPGDAIFAHLLLPHFPYVVGSDCEYLPWSKWNGRFIRSTLDMRRQAYYDQIHCTYRKLEVMLRAISRSAGGDRAVVIIHGDHGSRIFRVPPNAENYGKIDDADMIASFSTLFAVRAAGVEPVYFETRVPVFALLRDFANSKFGTAPEPLPPRSHIVYLANSEWEPVQKVPLPSYWTKGFDRPSGSSKSE